MRCPTLKELPPPPPGKAGWPWTEESPPLPDAMPDGRPWPRVSIVTPSYNQGQFIEETIRSVLLQGYPDLEYIIIDGGSTDGSVDIIRKYEPWLAYWVSEPDKGQADAINKGWRVATGEIIAYLNSDDIYYPEAIRIAVEFMIQYPEVGMIYGDCNFVDEDGQILLEDRLPEFNVSDFLLRRFIIRQPAVFLRRKVVESIGMLDPNLNYCMDYELWLRIVKKFPIVHISEVLAAAKVHIHAKSIAKNVESAAEAIAVFERFFSQNLPYEILVLRNRVLSKQYLWKAYTHYSRGQIIEAIKSAIIGFRLRPSLIPVLKVFKFIVKNPVLKAFRFIVKNQ
jgi:glycosyltransferase involved in cell wall biosynthesis